MFPQDKPEFELYIKLEGTYNYALVRQTNIFKFGGIAIILLCT